MAVSAMDQAGGAGRNTPPEIPDMPAVATREDFERFRADVKTLLVRFNRFFLWYQIALLILLLIAAL